MPNDFTLNMAADLLVGIRVRPVSDSDEG